MPHISDKIKFTLHEAAGGLKLLNGDFYIYGGAALVLSGIDIGETGDIDILTTSAHSDLLKTVWADKLIAVAGKKESELFRSAFAQYRFLDMMVEVSGDLEICKDNVWQPVLIHQYDTIQIGDLPVKVPTVEEQIRLLRLFGRTKDLQRLTLIENFRIPPP